MSMLSALFLTSVVAGIATGAPASNATQRTNYTGYSVVTVTPATAEHVVLLSRLQLEMQVDFWQEAAAAGSPAVVCLSPAISKMFIKKVSDAGMNVTVGETNLQKVIDTERRQMRFATYSNDPIIYQKYLRHNEMKDVLESYARSYKHVRLTSIGSSYEGRDLIAVHITTGVNKPIIFFECGIHPREWIAHATCLFIIHQLATKYTTDTTVKRLVDDFEWRIHPVVNPDGYEYTHDVDRLWRKTRTPSQLDPLCVGADANRNFPVFGEFCGIGASTNPCSEIYCGDSAFSEPETCAIRDAVLKVQGRISYYFSIHSYGLMWMYPYAYTKVHPANYEELRNITTRGTQAIRKATGTVYKTGPIAQTIYRVTGSSVDWAYDTAGVKRSFGLELQPSTLSEEVSEGFILPTKYILPTSQETWTGIRAAIGYP